MSASEVGRRQLQNREALLDELRALHRREVAPPELRQQLLTRLAAQPCRQPWFVRAFDRWLPVQGRQGLLVRASGALVACALLGLFTARLLSGAGVPTLRDGDAAERSEPAPLALGPEPTSGARRAPGAGRGLLDDARGRAAPSHSLSAPERACPLFEVASGAMIAAAKTSLDGAASGLALHTVDMDTPSCGPLTRRYLELVPPGLAPKSSAPVLLVLHDDGKSAELMRANSRARFDAMARREGFILVYANAAPGAATSVEIKNSGSWQSDPRTHPEVDDDEYLQRVVGDLTVRHVIDGNNDVYLAGYGGGAMMALSAAARQPQAYVGVAAILPSKPEAIEPPEHKAHARLSRAFFLLDEKSTLDVTNQALVRRWALALGVDRATRRRSLRLATRRAGTSRVQQLDAALPASGSAAVRLFVVERPFDPFPAAVDPSPKARPGVDPGAHVPDGVSDAWAFVSGAESMQPQQAEGLEPEPLELLGEPLWTDDPEIVLDADLLKGPSPPRP
jgi:poly(3-hydroxybutyrate) depolymerase